VLLELIITVDGSGLSCVAERSGSLNTCFQVHNFPRSFLLRGSMTCFCVQHLLQKFGIRLPCLSGTGNSWMPGYAAPYAREALPRRKHGRRGTDLRGCSSDQGNYQRPWQR